MAALIASVAIGAIGAGAKIISGMSQRHQANQIHPEYQKYVTSPYAKQQLALAQLMFGGRMPGAASEEQNIANTQSNYQGSIDRNSSDGSQSLLLGSLAGGASNSAYNNLQQKEDAYKNEQVGNLNQAYAGMTNEYSKEYQSMFDKYQSDVQAKSALTGAGATNVSTGFSDLSSTAFLGYLSSKYGGFGSNKTTPQVGTRPHE